MKQILLLLCLLAAPAYAGDVYLFAEDAQFPASNPTLGTNDAERIDVSGTNLAYRTIRCTHADGGPNDECWFTLDFTVPADCNWTIGSGEVDWSVQWIGYEGSTHTGRCGWEGSINVWTGNSPSNTRDLGIDTDGPLDVRTTSSSAHTAGLPYYTNADSQVRVKAADRGGENCYATPAQCVSKDATLYLSLDHGQTTVLTSCDFRMIKLSCPSL